MTHKFAYVGYDEAGARHQGEIDAVSTESAKTKLKEQSLVPVKIDRVDTSVRRARGTPYFSRAPGLDDIEFLTSQISLLLKNGVKIDRAIETARVGIKNGRLKGVVSEIYEDVRRGTSFSAALGKHPDIFDSLYVSIVSIGEVTGRLSDVSLDLAANLNFRQKISASTRQALIYPAIIFSVCVLSIFFVFNFIVPKFSVIFSGMKTIPVYTQIILATSELFKQYQFILPVLVAGLSFFVFKNRKRPQFQRVKDMLMLKLPLLKQLCYSLENLRFASSMAILLKSGVKITEALDYAVQSVGNLFIRKKLLMVKEEVRQGKRFSEAIAKTRFFEDIFVGLIEVGEQTGDLSEIFSEIAGRLRRKYEEKVSNLIVFIEPVMIVFMGLVVGSVVVAMLLSLVSINDIQF